MGTAKCFKGTGKDKETCTDDDTGCKKCSAAYMGVIFALVAMLL